jgi:hypothetical protein
MAYYSAALAFSPIGAPLRDQVWSSRVALEVSFMPPLSEAQRSQGFQKTESTNLTPILPRPRVSIALPWGIGAEGSWVPPVKAFGVTANLWSVAFSRSFDVATGWMLTPRVAGSTGYVTGPITCNTELRDRGGGDLTFYSYICHDTESADRFEPRAASGEFVLSRAARGRALTPYVGVGARREWTRFDVGVRFSDGSVDPAHPILEMNLTRAYGLAGVTWHGDRRTAVSGEVFYAPGSLLTARSKISLAMPRSR